MANLFSVIFLVALIVGIVFIRKAGKLKKSGMDNSRSKKIGIVSIAIALVAMVIIGIITPTTEPSAEPVATSDDKEEVEAKEEAESAIREGGIIIKDAEKGKYGKDLVLNEGSDAPDNIIGHFVPSGKYEVTNLGDKPTQVNVYKNEKAVTEEGWEEWADTGDIALLKPNESAEITIEDGYFVNADAPAYIVLNPIG
ncbi:hypothetical protein [Butyrivibrio sp. M55]|uniref:hypothetical protein n=1 Tax=Butyrivibrio sp. M55 TaxID=1855323 RepID=UPI0008E5BE18|nr:hypothetical protein [Butyrivibrio sp. M55]SFU74346.1 hypothetical protein SAMN05216540_1084 [Butyrivibrio sp. M55]